MIPVFAVSDNSNTSDLVNILIILVLILAAIALLIYILNRRR